MKYFHEIFLNLEQISRFSTLWICKQYHILSVQQIANPFCRKKQFIFLFFFSVKLLIHFFPLTDCIFLIVYVPILYYCVCCMGNFDWTTISSKYCRQIIAKVKKKNGFFKFFFTDLPRVGRTSTHRTHRGCNCDRFTGVLLICYSVKHSSAYIFICQVGKRLMIDRLEVPKMCKLVN